MTKHRIIFLSLTMLAFFTCNLAYAQTQAPTDTAKAKPKYEYVFATMTTTDTTVVYTKHPYKHKVEVDIVYESGKSEKFYQAIVDEIPGIHTYDAELFKCFNYLGTMGFELVTSQGSPQTSAGGRYIFKRMR